MKPKALAAALSLSFFLILLLGCNISITLQESSPSQSSAPSSLADQSSQVSDASFEENMSKSQPKSSEHSSSDISSLPPEKRLENQTRAMDFCNAETLWGCIAGWWWIPGDDHYITYGHRGNEYTFFTGMWDSEPGRGDGTLREIQFASEIEVRLIIDYPDQPANELGGGYDAVTQTVLIDIRNLEQDGMVPMKIDQEEFKDYAYVGKTYEEAYTNAHSTP